MNACIELVGFSTSNKDMNLWHSQKASRAFHLFETGQIKKSVHMEKCKSDSRQPNRNKTILEVPKESWIQLLLKDSTSPKRLNYSIRVLWSGIFCGAFLHPGANVKCAINPFMPAVQTFAVRETDVSRHNGGTSGAPLKPLRDDRALRALSFLRGLRGAPKVPPLCRETQSLEEHMLNATVGINGLIFDGSKEAFMIPRGLGLSEGCAPDGCKF